MSPEKDSSIPHEMFFMVILWMALSAAGWPPPGPPHQDRIGDGNSPFMFVDFAFLTLSAKGG